MNPTLALVIAEIARQVPALAVDLVEILSKPEATPADWAALRARWDRPASSFYKTPPSAD
jgi:hypothetical protein